MKTRRMKAARVASAVAFVLSLALYVASFFVSVYRISPAGRGMIIWEGVTPGGYTRMRLPEPAALRTGVWEVFPYPRPRFALFLPHAYWDKDGLRLRLPFWIPLCVFGVLPAVGIVGRWRERRRASRVGFCARCGYDLRATPERCPECGTACDADAGERRG